MTDLRDRGRITELEAEVERGRWTQFRARFTNGEVIGEPRIDIEDAVNALYAAYAVYPFVVDDEQIVVEKRFVGPWEPVPEVRITQLDD